MKKYKILLVDDDTTLIKGTSLYLEQKGYHVFTADSGKAAIDSLQSSPFDLVLTDLVMPDIDGFQVLKKAKKLYPEIMVIIMTGFGDVKFAIDCLRLGADDYMIKRSGPEEMLFRVKSCLEKLEIKRKIKKSDDALKDSEKLYRSLIETTDTGYVVIDEFGKIKDGNKESLRVIGIQSLEEILGRNISEWTAEYDREKFAKGIQICCDQGFIRNFEFDVIDVHGKITPIEVHATLIDTKKGRVIIALSKDITDRKQLEQKQNRINEILEDKVKERTADLEDMNTALRVLLDKRDKDKKEIEEKLFANYKLLILPFIDQLRKALTQKKQQDLINILESELKNIISPFSKKLSDPLINLTPTEIKVASLIKIEKSNKEIAEILNSSIHTISHHRENIRKKTGLKNKKINLKSFLSTLSSINAYFK